MRKIKFFLATNLILILISSCSTFENTTIYEHPVRYFTSTIMNSDGFYVTLANQTTWKTDRLSTFANFSPVLVVLEENINVGDMFVGNLKYGINGGIFDDFFYKTGFLQIFQSYDTTKHVITLFNGSKWEIPDTFDKYVKRWASGTEIIITEDKKFIINARGREKIPVTQINKIL